MLLVHYKSVCVLEFNLNYRIKFLFRPRPGEQHKDHQFYRTLFPQILRNIQVSYTCVALQASLVLVGVWHLAHQ